MRGLDKGFYGISKELGASFKYKEKYSKSQVLNIFSIFKGFKKVKNKFTADESNECLYPNIVETLGIRKIEAI